MVDETSFTTEELMAVCIARQIKDGDVLAQGLATPIVAAGYLLAWHTHAPNSYFASAIGQSVCSRGAPLGVETVEDLWLGNSMASFGFVSAVADLLPTIRPVEFFRPGQVDAAGNSNNIAIGRSYAKPRLRLPGVGGIPDVTTYFPEVFLYVPRHTRVTFVQRVDHLSGLGHGADHPLGGGPRYLVSNLGQFDFEPGRMRLTHLHPGVNLARVRSKTGFDLDVAEDLRESSAPTKAQLQILREVVDPLGVRNLEAMSGAKRRAALRAIIDRERTEGRT